MDLEDELQRVLRDDRLDIPVRTGAEWSLVAGARRRRQRNDVLALAGSALATALLVGSGIALVGQEPSAPLPPAAPPVPVSAPAPGSATWTSLPEPPPAPPQAPQYPPAQAPTYPGVTGTPSATSEPPEVLTTTSEPDPRTSEPSVTSSGNPTSSQRPATEAPGP